jgi:hypothetical protein
MMVNNSTNMNNTHKKTTYNVKNLGPVVKHAQQYGGVKPDNGNPSDWCTGSYLQYSWYTKSLYSYIFY